jgi:hypothetical protein
MRIKEPLSTLSNALYGVVGVLVLMDGFANGLTLAHVYVSLSAFWLMVGSAWYHATLKNPGQSYDEVAMYMLLGSLLGLGTVALGSPEVFGLTLWLLATIAAFALWDNVDSFLVVPVMAIGVALLVVAYSGIGEGLWLFSIFAVSVLIRQIGEKYHGSLKGELFHSVWHFGTAAAMYLTFTLLIK